MYIKVKVKVKRHYTLNREPLSEEALLQKRSEIARVVGRFHSFTCTPMRLSTNGMNHTCLSLPGRSWSSFTDSGGMEGWVGLGTTTVSKQSTQNRYVTGITAVSCSTAMPHRQLERSGYGRRTHDLSSRDANHWATESPIHTQCRRRADRKTENKECLALCAPANKQTWVSLDVVTQFLYARADSGLAEDADSFGCRADEAVHSVDDTAGQRK